MPSSKRMPSQCHLSTLQSLLSANALEHQNRAIILANLKTPRHKHRSCSHARKIEIVLRRLLSFGA